ncbi:MAG TPA: cytochrome b N-terminal domain-containing protein [Thermosynechococcaceae cyanobacterium]
MKDFAFILRRLSTILAVVMLTLTLIAATSGILMAFYYTPSAGGSNEALQTLASDVSFGWLVLSLHHLAGNAVIVVGLIQIVVMFLGERFRRSWLTAWISGILFVLAAIGLSWTAIILDWSQLGYWRFRIELGTIEALPLIGPQVRDILTGGAIGTITVEHLYTLHSFVVSFAAVGLSLIHLGGLLIQELEIRRVAAEPPIEALASEVVPPTAQTGAEPSNGLPV